MEDENDKIKENLSEFSENLSYGKKKSNLYKKNIIIIISLSLVVVIAITIILLIILLSSQSSSDSDSNPPPTPTPKNIVGEISCEYNIETTEALILGNNFQKLSDFDIIIEGKKVDYNIKYKFEKFGKYNIQFILYNDINMFNMFKDVDSLIEVNMTTENDVKILNIENCFENCINLNSVNIKGFNFNQIKSFHKLFYKSGLTSYNIQGDISTIEDISYMLAGTNIEYIDLNNLLKDSILNASHLFDNCKILNNIELSNINTINIKDISYMFNYCESLTSLDLSYFNTNNVLNMTHLFDNCILLSNLITSNFNTNNVRDMSYMFNDCHSLINLDLSHFKTDNVKNMSHMFCNCNSIQKLDISKFKTNNVEDMSNMFYLCHSLISLDTVFNTVISLTAHIPSNLKKSLKEYYTNLTTLIQNL